jgi:hypothetical protein
VTKNEKITVYISCASTSIALFALIISSFTFYYQVVREEHDLRMAILDIRTNEKECTTDVLFFNYGNQPETVTAIIIGLRTNDSRLIQGGISTETKDMDIQLKEPIIIKPGDVVHKTISTSIKSILESEKISAGRRFKVVITVINLADRGVKISKEEIGHIEFGEGGIVYIKTHFRILHLPTSRMK